MSSVLTMYGRTQLLAAMLSPDTYTTPATVKLALCQRIPPSNASIDQLLEPDTGTTTYARQTYGFSSAHWTGTGFGEFTNAVAITFPEVGLNSWGMVAGWAMIDVDAAQCLAVGSVLEPYLTALGMIPTVNIGSIVLGISD